MQQVQPDPTERWFTKRGYIQFLRETWNKDEEDAVNEWEYIKERIDPERKRYTKSVSQPNGSPLVEMLIRVR